jgi:hypothetical protein
MTNTSVTFGLEIGYYDSVAEADAGKGIVLATPQFIHELSSAYPPQMKLRRDTAGLT